jgi:hypothetical protein
MWLQKFPKLINNRFFELYFQNSTHLLVLKVFKKLIGFRTHGAIQLDKAFTSRQWNNLGIEQIQISYPDYCKLENENGEVYSIKSFSSIFEYCLTNVIVDTTSGGIFENKANPRAFFESAPFPIETLSESLRPRPPRGAIKGEVSVLSNRSYWHWLIDDLPRFLLVHERSPNINVLAHPKPRGYVRDALKVINPSKITYASVALVERVRFISVGNVESFPSLRDIKILKSFAAKFDQPSSEYKRSRIFISRRFAPSRNSREVYYEKLALRSNFQILYCENISLQEQIDVFSNASIIVAANGAALANVVWCQPKVRIHEISDHDWESDCVRDLCALLGLKYRKTHFSQVEELFEELRQS